jgi:diacylglycerol O-acyltransferase
VQRRAAALAEAQRLVPRKPLIASMPISLREQGNTEMRTQATLSLVSLASNIADPVKRLQAIRDSAGATKAVARQAKSVIPTDIPLLGVPWLLGALAALYGRSSVVDRLPILANVLISNVPGPPVPLYVDGLRMTGYWPLSIVEHGVGINITLLSYAGNAVLRLRRGEECRARRRRTGAGFHRGLGCSRLRSPPMGSPPGCPRRRLPSRAAPRRRRKAA